MPTDVRIRVGEPDVRSCVARIAGNGAAGVLLGSSPVPAIPKTNAGKRGVGLRAIRIDLERLHSRMLGLGKRRAGRSVAGDWQNVVGIGEASIGGRHLRIGSQSRGEILDGA